MNFEFWPGGQGFPHPHRHPHWHGRRFKRGMLKWIVLKILDEGERHGYDFMRFFRERGWERAPGAGSIYPLLAHLEEEGLVQGRDEDGKRIYTITEKGRTFLHERGPHIEFKDFESQEEPADSPLTEAMKRFGIALAQIAKGASPETAQRVTEILNAARKEIYTLLANE